MDLVTSLPIYGQLQSATAARLAGHHPNLLRNFFLQLGRQLLASLLILCATTECKLHVALESILGMALMYNI